MGLVCIACWGKRWIYVGFMPILLYVSTYLIHARVKIPLTFGAWSYVYYSYVYYPKLKKKKKHEWITAEEAWMKFSDFLTRNAIYQCRKYWLLATFIIIRLSNWYWPVVVVFVAWHIGMLIFVNFLMQICLMICLSFSPSLILIDLVCYTDPWAAKLYDISVAVCAV